jgi:hypothetical protein
MIEYAMCFPTICKVICQTRLGIKMDALSVVSTMPRKEEYISDGRLSRVKQCVLLSSSATRRSF